MEVSVKESIRKIVRKAIDELIEDNTCIDCGHITGDDNTWVDTDVSAKDDKIKNIANVVWTQTEKDGLKAALIKAKN